MVVVGIGLALALLWLMPWWLDNRRAYRLRERTVELISGRILDVAAKEGLTVEDLRVLLGTLRDLGGSERETARAVMSFILITVIGVALAALLLSSASDADDLRKTVIASILTLLGTIVGFYFGTRAAESGTDLNAPPAIRFVPPPPAASPVAGWAAEEPAATASERFPPGPGPAAPAPGTEGEAPPSVAKETPPGRQEGDAPAVE